MVTWYWSANTLSWQLSINHNMDVQYQRFIYGNGATLLFLFWRTYVRTYGHVRTKDFKIDGLSKFLRFGAPLVRFGAQELRHDQIAELATMRSARFRVNGEIYEVPASVLKLDISKKGISVLRSFLRTCQSHSLSPPSFPVQASHPDIFKSTSIYHHFHQVTDEKWPEPCQYASLTLKAWLVWYFFNTVFINTQGFSCLSRASKISLWISPTHD